MSTTLHALRTGFVRGALFLIWLPSLVLGMFIAGCSDDGDTFLVPEDPPAAMVPSELGPRDDPPGVNFEITEVRGATGNGGSFQPGDQVTLRYSVTMNNGSPWDLSQLGSVRALVSGPSFNYQRVLVEQSDLITASRKIEAGVYEYSFANRIPEVYEAPYNDSDFYGPEDGEWTGQSLVSGTYTLGLYGYWNYSVDSTDYRDHGDATADFALGDPVPIVPRAVTSNAHCDQCHDQVQAHGGFRRSVDICILCHTSGAEDRNDPGAGLGTPGASIDFKIMIHKIHNGAHLPSVLGVATHPDGSRNYDAPPMAYELVGFGSNVHDYSDVVFPIWPNLSSPLPKDAGYTSLSPSQQDQEDMIRQGAATCEKCHGDPDGDGPIEMPSQGDLAFAQPTRGSCGSCHDDVNWEFPYVANFQTMPPQLQDGDCLTCHPADGTQLATRDVHRHPLHDPSFSPGINFDVTSLEEEGDSANMDDTLDTGEKIQVTFNVNDDAGQAVDLAALGISSVNFVVSGPTTNYNLILSSSFSTSLLSGSGPQTILLPQPVSFDFAGVSTSTTNETFPALFAPFRAEGSVTVLVTGADDGPPRATTAAMGLTDNSLELDNVSDLDAGDVIVIDRNLPEEEYFAIQFVEGNRVWISTSQTMAAQFEHQNGAIVQEVETDDTLVEGSDYSVDTVNGTITEIGDFGADVAVILSYLTDFVMPTIHPRPLNAAPEVTETTGKWSGKGLVDGTYTLTLYAAGSLTLDSFGEQNSYKSASTSEGTNFLVGAASSEEPYELISGEENCYSCHDDIYFHGSNRRGFAACLACHGTAGSEDRPRYVNASLPPTTGVTIDFRSMLHKIHMGEELSEGAAYEVNGFSGPVTFEHVVFPSMPTGPKDCKACHGDDNTAYLEPQPRNHPTEQGAPTQVWVASCVTCHDSSAAAAHASGQIDSNGNEACSVCHGPGRFLDVDVSHKIRQN